MINFTLPPSHYLCVGRGSVCPLNGSLYSVCWAWGECSSELGCGGPCNWTHGHVCSCIQSCVCKGLEVFFPVCILFRHTVVLMPVNEHMAASRS